MVTTKAQQTEEDAAAGKRPQLENAVRYNAMPLMCTPFEPGHIEEAISSIQNPDYRAIAQAEAHYFCSRHDEACQVAEPYLESEDLALRVSASFICAYANLSFNRSYASRMCLQALQDLAADPRIEEDDALHASYMLITAASNVLLHMESPIKLDDFKVIAANLPEGLRLFASYAVAHFMYLRGEYGQCVGIAESALMMKQDSYPISELFLHMVTAMGWMSLKEPEKARAQFMQGWEIARPDDLIEEIGEHHGLLQGVLETCLKDAYPQDYERIIKITYRFSYGWRRVHNPETGEEVADNLTTMEFTVAMLACRGWGNDEIAAHMGVSRGTVKNHLSSVYAKLGIEKRSQLKDYMLR